jgi:hypothetical protein
MDKIAIGRRLLETPVLIPSISSFETQLQPADALRLQITLQEPISLVSAYDVFHNEDELVRLCTDFRQHGALLLDSGGYESSRISRYARAEPSRWTFDNYTQIASKDIYDLIFSFDYFIEESESANAFAERILNEFHNHANYLDITKLIPVLHVQTVEGKRRLDETELLDLFKSVVSGLQIRFVAVAERELGAGIISRAKLVQRIAQAIRRGSSDCLLHILGCGNLLSFSLFSVAGAIMCDGLEWCRTYAAANFHLHHFQQQELFTDPRQEFGNPMWELISGAGLPYHTAAAGHNLLNFQLFKNNLQDRLNERTVHDFISKNYGALAGEAILALES